MKNNCTIKSLGKQINLIKDDNDFLDYIETLEYKNILIHLFNDDYGQSYYIKFKINDNEQEVGLGTYNFNYEEQNFISNRPTYLHP
jgi:hypothetical protein